MWHYSQPVRQPVAPRSGCDVSSIGPPASRCMARHGGAVADDRGAGDFTHLARCIVDAGPRRVVHQPRPGCPASVRTIGTADAHGRLRLLHPARPQSAAVEPCGRVFDTAAASCPGRALAGIGCPRCRADSQRPSAWSASASAGLTQRSTRAMAHASISTAHHRTRRPNHDH